MLPRPLRGGGWSRLARRHTADIDRPGDLRIADTNTTTARLHILDAKGLSFDPFEVHPDRFPSLGVVRTDGLDYRFRRSQEVRIRVCACILQIFFQ